MPTFARENPKADKRTRGRTSVARTPVAIRSRVPLSAKAERDIRAQLARPLGRLAPTIERATVRFDDVNGPRGGVDTRCRIEVVLSGHDSVVLEGRGATARQAITRAVPRLVRAVDEQVARRATRVRKGERARLPVKSTATPVTKRRPPAPVRRKKLTTKHRGAAKATKPRVSPAPKRTKRRVAKRREAK